MRVDISEENKQLYKLAFVSLWGFITYAGFFLILSITGLLIILKANIFLIDSLYFGIFAIINLIITLSMIFHGYRLLYSEQKLLASIQEEYPNCFISYKSENTFYIYYGYEDGVEKILEVNIK
jgi:hypothetical protein